MSDDVPSPAENPEVIRLVSALLETINRAPAADKRLAEMRNVLAKIEQARAELNEASAGHIATVTRDRAEIDELRTSVRKRELGIRAREVEVAHAQENIRTAKADLERRFGVIVPVAGGVGMTQEFPRGEPRSFLNERGQHDG